MIAVLLLVIPLLGAVVTAALPSGDRRTPLVVGIVSAAATLVVSVVAAARLDWSRSTPQLGIDRSWIASLGVRAHLGLDGISLPLVMLTALLVLLCCVHLVRHAPEPVDSVGRLVALVLLLEVGMLGTFLALDLLLFFVAFEVVLVPMYLVIAQWGGQHRQRAATKFVLYTLAGSTLLLLGLLVLRQHAGTSDMVALASRHGAGLSGSTQLLAFVLIALGLAVKSPLWPLHTWLPDAHSEAPTVGSVLLAGVLLKMGTYGLVRIAIADLPDAARRCAPVLGALAVLAIVYGSLCCLGQRDAKRLIAYSSVGHLGFVVLGISTLTQIGVSAALLGNIAHGVITGLLFFLIGGLKERTHSTQLDVVGPGLLRVAPRFAGVLVLACVASLGLPGLAGFWGELLAMLGAFHPGAGLPVVFFRVLLGVALVGTLLTAGYLLLLVQRVVQGRRAEGAPALAEASFGELAVWSPLVVLTVVLGLFPALVLDVGRAAVGVVVGTS